MNILDSVMGFVSKRDKAAYECWMCGKGHNNPTAFLWHIRACELETTGKSRLLAKGKAILPAIIIHN